MQRRTVIASIGAIVGTSVGAAAYTSATVTRDATFTVATDASDALIGLNAGTSDRITATGDTLEISIQNLNTGGTFIYGDAKALDTAHAFSITNNEETNDRSITLSYDTPGVTFELFEKGADWTDAETSPLGEVSKPENEAANEVTWTAEPGKEVRVVMTVDTDGVGSGEDALNGMLTFTATDSTAT